MSNKITIIIPTLNEATEIAKTLAAIRPLDAQVIVADGGSEDETVNIALSFCVTVINAPRGRGIQMHKAAQIASGNVLWFLHADSTPSPGSLNEINRSLENPKVVGGNFTIRFGGESRSARFMTWFYPRIRSIGLMYGDSGIFVRREIYEKIGGFKPLPLFEDLDLVYRLRRAGKVVNLDAEIVTSSRRFENRAFAPVFLRWVIYQCLYWIGVSPHRLAKAYYPELADTKPNTPTLQ